MARRPPLVWALFALVSSCALTTFQTPEVLPPGKAAVGGGVAVGLGPTRDVHQGEYVPAVVIPELDCWARLGIARGIDAGIRATEQWSLTLLTGDMRQQMTVGGTKISTGMGALACYTLIGESPVEEGIAAVVPSFLIGRGDFFVGARIQIPVTRYDYPSSVSVPIGIVMRKPKWTSIVEVDIHLMDLQDPYPMISLGLGRQYNL